MRSAVTIIEKTPGGDDWAVALDPSCNPQDHREFLKSLPPGDQRAQILESGRGHGKRRKVSWSPSPAKKKAPKK